MESMKFGKSLVEETAAALYHSFHGHCECTAHPFFDSDNGVELPWTRYGSDDDVVVAAFREAAAAAQRVLLNRGIGRKYR